MPTANTDEKVLKEGHMKQKSSSFQTLLKIGIDELSGPKKNQNKNHPTDSL